MPKWLRASAALGLALACVAGHAELPAEMMERPAREFIAEALATGYGRVITAQFGDILRRSAEPGCVRQKDLDLRALDARAREILERRGAQMFDTLRRAHDGARFAASFTALGGTTARTEYIRLREEPGVAKLLELSRPGRQARILDMVAENLDRYALLHRIAMQGRIAPLGSGDQRLLAASPAESAEAAAAEHVRSDGTPAVRRWLELQDAFYQAMGHARQTDAMLRLGPSQLMAGLDEDLAALCVPRR